jgi:hypothetical protein
MACDRMRELALLDVDDALAAAERAELDLHLAGCAECRAARDGARRVARGLARIPVPPVPLGFSERTLQRIERATTVAARPRAWLVRLSAAAALVAAAAVFWVELGRTSAPKSTHEEVAKQESLTEAAAGRAGESRLDGDDAADKAREARKAQVADEQARSDEPAKEGAARGDAAPPAAPAAAAVPLSGEKQGKDFEVEKDGDARKAGDDAAAKPGAAGGKLEELKAVAPDVEELERDLERGAPADALRRIGALANAETAKSDDLEKNVAKKADDKAPPQLHFVRARGDVARIAELSGAHGDALARDGTDRIVLELTADEAKALEGRLALAGVKLEPLSASDWLAALRESVERARQKTDGAVARGEPPKSNAEPDAGASKAPPTPPATKSRGNVGAPAKGAPTGGAAKHKIPEQPPPPRVRWIVLAGK